MQIEKDYKRRWFERYKKRLSVIERLKQRYKNLDSRLKTPRSPSYTGMPRGGSAKTPEDLIGEKIEIENRIRRLKTGSEEIKREILEVIDAIGDANLCEVLEYRYIDDMEPEEIAEVMGYGSRHIQRLLSQAIEEAEIPGSPDPAPEDMEVKESE